MELCGQRIFLFPLVLNHWPVRQSTLLWILLQEKFCSYSIAYLFTFKPLVSPA